MNPKVEIVVRVIARSIAANLYPQSERSSGFGIFDEFFRVESRQERTARLIEEQARSAINAADRINTNRKFKKITKEM